MKSKTQSDFTTLKERLGYPAVESAEELSKAMDDDVKSVLGSVDLNTIYRDAILALGRLLAVDVQEDMRSLRVECAVGIHHIRHAALVVEYAKHVAHFALELLR